MNEHQYKIEQARVKYPLRKTILINPQVPAMVNEFDEELPKSYLRNVKIVERFIGKLEAIYKQENTVDTERYFASKEEKDLMARFLKERELNWFLNPTEGLVRDNRKLAKVIIEGKEVMKWVDNETMVAYDMVGMYEKTDEIIPEYKFVRWCRPMDV